MVSTKFSLTAIALASAALSVSGMKVMAGSPAAQALTRHNAAKPAADPYGPAHDSRPSLGKTPRTGGGKSGAKPHSHKPGHSSRPGISKPSRSGGKPAGRPLGPAVDAKPIISNKPTRNMIKRSVRTSGPSQTRGAGIYRPLMPGPSPSIIKRSVRTSGPSQTRSGGISKLLRPRPLIYGITSDMFRGPRVLKHREMVEEILEELERRELELDDLE